jgi:hypothetical protein
MKQKRLYCSDYWLERDHLGQNLSRGRIKKKWCMRPYAGADYNLTLCPLQSRLQYIYHGQSNARVGLNPMPESNLAPSKGLWIWPWERLHYAMRRKIQL